MMINRILCFPANMGHVKLLILVTFFTLHILGYVNGKHTVGIAGGSKIPITAAPFMVSIVRYATSPKGFKYFHACGGSIIHERFVLTAAHCIEDKVEKDVIRVGSAHLLQGGKTYGIEKMISHEDFMKNESYFKYDVALIKLDEPLEFGPNVSKVILADDSLQIKPHTRVNITGWGRTGRKGHVSKELRQVTVKTTSNDNCLIYPWANSEEICVWTYKKGSCKGDSGGPMTKGNVQVGIVSNGLACDFFPGVFAKVSFLLPWIKQTIKDNL